MIIKLIKIYILIISPFYFKFVIDIILFYQRKKNDIYKLKVLNILIENKRFY